MAGLDHKLAGARASLYLLNWKPGGPGTGDRGVTDFQVDAGLKCHFIGNFSIGDFPDAVDFPCERDESDFTTGFPSG